LDVWMIGYYMSRRKTTDRFPVDQKSDVQFGSRLEVGRSAYDDGFTRPKNRNKRWTALIDEAGLTVDVLCTVALIGDKATVPR